MKKEPEQMDAFYKRISREMSDANKMAVADEKKWFIKREMARVHTNDDGCICD
ncbi:hypothetical protein CCP3SC15_380003 [Gammaproteobacteria bacterium]